MSTKKAAKAVKVGGRESASASLQTTVEKKKKANAEHVEVDPNNQLKADCGSDLHDEILNLPHSFARRARAKQTATATGGQLPRISKRDTSGLALAADHPILRKMLREQKEFGSGLLLEEITSPAKPTGGKRRGAQSAVKAAGLDGAFEVFLDGSPSRGKAGQQSLRMRGPMASQNTNKASHIMQLVEFEHNKIRENLVKAARNQETSTRLVEKGRSQNRSKEQLLSSINEDATNATRISMANPKTEEESRLSIKDMSIPRSKLGAADPLPGLSRRHGPGSPSTSLKANENKGGISSVALRQRNDLQKYIKQQQYFRDTHTSRTANSKEGRRAAFVEYRQQMNDQAQPSVGEGKQVSDSSKVFNALEQYGTPIHSSKITRNGSQVLLGKDEETIKGSIHGSGSFSLHQTPQSRVKKTYFQYRHRSVIPFQVRETAEHPSGMIKELEDENGTLDSVQFQKNLARQSKLRGFGKKTIDNTTDFESFNMSALKDMKNTKMERCSQNIAGVHARLMNVKQVSNQSADLERIHKCLSPFFREVFLSNPRHSAVLSDMNFLNGCFIDIIDYACSYRIELGNSLQSLIECYNSIFLQQFQIFYDHKLEKEKELDQKIRECATRAEELEKQKQAVEDQRLVRIKLLESKDQELQTLRQSQGNLEQQIDQLTKMLHKDEEDTKKLAQDLADNKENLAKDKKEKGLHLEANYTAKQRSYIASNFQENKGVLFNPEYQKDLEVAISTAEEQIDEKQKTLREMQQVFKKIMRNNSVNKSVQTEEAIWNDLPQRLKYHHDDDSMSSDPSDGEDSQDSEVQERRKQKAMNERLEVMKEERKIVIEEESQLPNDLVQSLPRAQESSTDVKNLGDSNLQESQQVNLKKSASQAILPNNRIDVGQRGQVGVGDLQATLPLAADTQPESTANLQNDVPTILDPPQVCFNKSLRQNGLRAPGQLQVLHDKFLAICQRVKSIHTDKATSANQNRKPRGEWKIPFSIIAFCANRIKELIAKPEQVESWALIPWKKYKQMIYLIYEHRVEHAPEINGSSNLNYCCMSEHVLVYFIDLLKERQLAEDKVVELIINLSYYYDQWLRARMFAANLQLVHAEPEKSAVLPSSRTEDSESNDSQADQQDEYGDEKADRADAPPHGLTGDAQVPENDLFAQEFFLHCFNTLSQAHEAFVESAKGGTYLRLQDHDRFAKQLIGTLRGPSGNLTRWKHKMKALVTRIPIEGLDVDFLDLDQVLGALVNEFKDQKRSFQNRLKKEFVRKMEAYTAPVGYKEFEELIHAAEMGDLDDDGFFDPLISFAGPMSQIRAYIFCLTAGESNTSSFSNEHFVAGISRYGVENPTPCVSKRCGMYGNSEDIMRALKRAEDVYGKLRMRIHTKRYSGVKNVEAKPKMHQIHLTRTRSQTNVYEEIEPSYAAEDKLAQPPDPEKPKPHPHREKLAGIADLKFELVGAMKAKCKGQDARQEAASQEEEKEKNRYFVFHGTTLRVQNLKDFRHVNASALEQKLREKNELAPPKLLGDDSAHHGSSTDPEAEDQDAEPDQMVASARSPTPTGSNQGTDKQQNIQIKDIRQQDLTQIQYAMSHKQILVPTMGSLSAVFQQHLSILGDLRDKVFDLQQAYFQQKDPERTWKEVDLILLVLRNGCRFLDFPEQAALDKYKIAPPETDDEVHNPTSKLSLDQVVEEADEEADSNNDENATNNKDGKEHKDPNLPAAEEGDSQPTLAKNPELPTSAPGETAAAEADGNEDEASASLEDMDE